MVITVTVIYSLSTGNYILPLVFLMIIIVLALLKKRYGGSLVEKMGETDFKNT